jgi:hypothetical protein
MSHDSGNVYTLIPSGTKYHVIPTQANRTIQTGETTAITGQALVTRVN